MRCLHVRSRRTATRSQHSSPPERECPPDTLDVVAKKARTPAPPRPVQAPKRRVEPRQKQKPKAAPPGIPLEAARYWVIGGIAVLIVVGVIVGFVVSKGGGSANAAGGAKIAKAAGGTFVTVPATRAALHIRT